jgi:hypothetical protein
MPNFVRNFHLEKLGDYGDERTFVGTNTSGFFYWQDISVDIYVLSESGRYGVLTIDQINP